MHTNIHKYVYALYPFVIDGSKNNTFKSWNKSMNMSTWIMSRTSLVYVHRSLSGLNLASVLELDPTAWQLTIMVLTYHCRFSHLIVISIVGTRLDLTINLIPFKLKKSHYSYSTHCITYTPCHSTLHHLTRITTFEKLKNTYEQYISPIHHQ